MAIASKKTIRQRLHTRLRRKVSGTSERPRLSVNFSGRHIYAQLIDDQIGKTLVSAMSTEKSLDSSKLKPNAKSAEQIGKLVAERAKAKSIAKIVFDRGGFKYHGKVKALADAARAAGLEF
ncbi:MAG: 50S ribosomal protein L18 [Verrucomicrobium sp.]|nr:50S ribosomal protein L18 [Verrucomicrobium sp.]